MAGKYAPVPANDPYTHGDPAINSPATLRVCSISNQISQMPSITPQSTITSTEIMKPESELQSNNSGITKTEIENIVNSQLDLRIQETQTQSQQPTS
ncbi:18849_t:CDS:2 [Entrophospora sp. SA101]|nr:18849_t:CDS:2 [Entrophospora sp. SA101]